MRTWAAIGSGFAGVLVAVQSRANGGLSQTLGNGWVAAAVSFGLGFVILTVVLVCSRRGRRGLGQLRKRIRSRELPLWMLGGGVAGASFVAGQGLVAPITGLALFTVGIVAGQVLGGLVLDRLGLGPGGRIDPTPTRILGTVLAVVAVGVAVGGNESSRAVLLFVLIPVVIGAGVSAQSMVNGVTRAAAESAVTSTWVNFLVGTTILVVTAIISIVATGWPTEWPISPFAYIGGVVGPVFIALAAILVRAAGVLLLSMANVAGQMIASVVFEAVAPLSSGLTGSMISGAAIALLAVIIAALPSPQKRR